MRQARLSVLLLVALVAACGDGPSEPQPEGVAESELTFVRFATEAQPLVAEEGSFYAVKGENRELVLRYRPADPDDEGDDFLEFDVPGDALLRRPNGVPFARGDSVLITVRVVDASRFLFEFEPSGLVFDPERPAELEVTYRRADPDLNGDGAVTYDDQRVEDRLGIWGQQRPGELWYRQASLRIDDDLDEVEARVFHFSRFALAGH